MSTPRFEHSENPGRCLYFFSGLLTTDSRHQAFIFRAEKRKKFRKAEEKPKKSRSKFWIESRTAIRKQSTMSYTKIQHRLNCNHACPIISRQFHSHDKKKIWKGRCCNLEYAIIRAHKLSARQELFTYLGPVSDRNPTFQGMLLVSMMTAAPRFVFQSLPHLTWQESQRSKLLTADRWSN